MIRLLWEGGYQTLPRRLLRRRARAALHAARRSRRRSSSPPAKPQAAELAAASATGSSARRPDAELVERLPRGGRRRRRATAQVTSAGRRARRRRGDRPPGLAERGAQGRSGARSCRCRAHFEQAAEIVTRGGRRRGGRLRARPDAARRAGARVRRRRLRPRLRPPGRAATRRASSASGARSCGPRVARRSPPAAESERRQPCPGQGPRPEHQGRPALRGAARGGREQGEGGADRQRGRERGPLEDRRRGGKSGSYDETGTSTSCASSAAKVGIEGRSKMKKRELVKALRNH